MTYQMSKEQKDGIIQLALTASVAFKAYNDALNAPKEKEQMDKLMEQKNATFAALKTAVAGLDLNKVKEVFGQFKHRLENDPLAYKGEGEFSWDGQKAETLVNAMRSLQSALEQDGDEHKNDKNRIYVAKSRINGCSLFVTLCREAKIAPQNGMTGGTVRYALRELDKRIHSLTKAGDNTKTLHLAKLYQAAKYEFDWLLKQADERDKQRRSQGFRMGQILEATPGENPADVIKKAITPEKPKSSRKTRKTKKEE